MDKKYFIFIWLFILNFSSQEIFPNVNFSSSNNSKKSPDTTFNRKSYNLQNELKISLFLLAENIENKKINNDSGFNAASIIADTQFRNENYFIAEGNVLVNLKDMNLKADKLKYDLVNNVIEIINVIKFESNAQYLKASKIKYDLKNKAGFIESAYGSINFGTLNKIGSKEYSEINLDEFEEQDKSIRNVQLNKSSLIGFEKINLKKEEKSLLQSISSQNLKVDFNDMQNWRFFSKRIEIKDEIWTSEKLFLTNDPFNKPQLVMNNNNFKIDNEDEEIVVKSKWSTLVLDNLIKIPVGPRRYRVNNNEDNKLKWDIGYDQKSKDGFFAGRNYQTIFLSKDRNTTLDLKQNFLIQRAILGETKSFSQKNDSVLGTKVKQDAKFLDDLGLEAVLNSRLLGFDFYSDIELNSLDFEKFKKIITVDTELSKVLYKKNDDDMQKKTIFSIFGKYRDKVWNGSLGEIEILGSYGTKIEKKNNWIDDNVKKSSTIAISYGSYKSGKSNDAQDVIERKRINLFLERNHTYPIWKPKIEKKFITSENKYQPYIIPYGLDLFIQTKADFYSYEDNNFQDLYTLKGGPELTLGNFKNKYFDYTKFKVFPKTTISNGESPFKFDQATDKHGVEFIIEQQLIGPLTMKLSTEYNLDINSPKYKDFHKNRFEIGWNRRAYNLSAYYYADNQEGGINFKIHSFRYKGMGKTFK